MAIWLVGAEVFPLNVRGKGMMHVTFANIGDAKLLITDRLIAATQPLSTEGVEDYEEAPEDAAEAEEQN